MGTIGADCCHLRAPKRQTDVVKPALSRDTGPWTHSFKDSAETTDSVDSMDSGWRMVDDGRKDE